MGNGICIRVHVTRKLGRAGTAGGRGRSLMPACAAHSTLHTHVPIPKAHSPACLHDAGYPRHQLRHGSSPGSTPHPPTPAPGFLAHRLSVASINPVYFASSCASRPGWGMGSGAYAIVEKRMRGGAPVRLRTVGWPVAGWVWTNRYSPPPGRTFGGGGGSSMSCMASPCFFTCSCTRVAQAPARAPVSVPVASGPRRARTR